MANHAFAALRGSTKAPLFGAFAEGVLAAAERFPGAYRVIEQDPEQIVVGLADPALGEVVCQATFWSSGKRVEWRHTADFGLTWWFEQTVAAIAGRAAADALGKPVVMTDEGVDDKMAPDYDRKYPRYSDWMRAMMDPLGTGKPLPPAMPILPYRLAALQEVVETVPVDVETVETTPAG